MKIKDLVEFLQTLDQDKEILTADYYYECREGFKPMSLDEFKKCLVPASAYEYADYGPVYLLDSKFV